MKNFKIASILMIIHGAIMEIGGCLCLIPILFGNNSINQNITFIVPYFKDNMNLMTVAGAIYGIMRVTGAIGLLKNRMWGLVLSIINCCITMTLMMFMLPVGIVDGLLSGTALVLILIGYYDNKKIK